MTAPIGLIAGGGELSSYLLSALKELGHEVVLVGFKDETQDELLQSVSRSIRVEVGELGKAIDFLKGAGVTEAMMAGTVRHTNLFRQPKTDSLTARLLATLTDKRADTLLKGAARELKRSGITLVSAMSYLKPLLPHKGVLTRRQPTDEEWKDITFGHGIARSIAGLDIGQTVVVKHQAVLAVEALEGTDQAILRAGELGRGDVVVVKVAKPRQDFRFDVPVVGVNTVATLKRARATVLAVEAGKTILLSREQVIAQADEANLSLVAI